MKPLHRAMATYQDGAFFFAVYLFFTIFCPVDATTDRIINELRLAANRIVLPPGNLCIEGEGIVVKSSFLHYDEECRLGSRSYTKLNATMILRLMDSLCKGRRKCLDIPKDMTGPAARCFFFSQNPYVFSMGYVCKPKGSTGQATASNDDGCGFKYGFGVTLALLLVALIALSVVCVKKMKKSRAATIENGQAGVNQENLQDYNGTYIDVVESESPTSTCVSQDLYASYCDLSETINQHPSTHYDISDDTQEDFHHYNGLHKDVDGYELPAASGIYEDFPTTQNASRPYNNNKASNKNLDVV